MSIRRVIIAGFQDSGPRQVRQLERFNGLDLHIRSPETTISRARTAHIEATLKGLAMPTLLLRVAIGLKAAIVIQ